MRKDAAILVYLQITGDDFPLDTFLQELGEKPILAGKKGERIEKSVNDFYHDCTYCTFGTDFVYMDEPLTEIHRLIDRFSPKMEVIQRYQQRYQLTCKLGSVVHFQDFQTPGLEIDQKAMQFALAIQADYTFDVHTGTLPPGM